MIAKTLTLRLEDNPDATKNLAFCAEKLGEKTASKTVIAAINTLPVYMRLAKEQDDKIDELRSEVNRLNSIIEEARYASLKLYEATSQQDLLSD